MWAHFIKYDFALKMREDHSWGKFQQNKWNARQWVEMSGKITEKAHCFQKIFINGLN